ncbi:MAG TPA: alpha/beta fold hydrolase [Vicinamibacterales bacterium]|nr:alpha/beta fold hydrolase [Vicinamibacterales bacterium]
MARSLHGGLVAALTGLVWAAGPIVLAQQGFTAREERIDVGGASLYVRAIGRGPDVIVLHGGPDFDHRYLLPDLDRLADRYRLIYYDQRGRGKSAENVNAADVTIASEVEDLDKVRQHVGRDSIALLGHSWGTVLALEYALRHPQRVSQLVLMNPAPASAADLAIFRKAYLAQLGPDMDRQRELASSAGYQAADPAAVTARYRVHFEHALARPSDYEKLIAAMNAAFVAQGSAGILEARAVEDHLMAETWQIDSYDLLPKLKALRIPTLVITGDRDFIPVEIAQHVAAAIPGARLVTLENCGHFSYMECPDDVRRALTAFAALK